MPSGTMGTAPKTELEKTASEEAAAPAKVGEPTASEGDAPSPDDEAATEAHVADRLGFTPQDGIHLVLDCGSAMESLDEGWWERLDLASWTASLRDARLAGGLKVYPAAGTNPTALENSAALSLRSAPRALCGGRYADSVVPMVSAAQRVRARAMANAKEYTALVLISDGRFLADEAERSRLVELLADARALWVGLGTADYAGRVDVDVEFEGGADNALVLKSPACDGWTQGRRAVREQFGRGAYTLGAGPVKLLLLVALYGEGGGEAEWEQRIEGYETALFETLFSGGQGVRLFPMEPLRGTCSMPQESSEAGAVSLDPEHCALSCIQPVSEAEFTLSQTLDPLATKWEVPRQVLVAGQGEASPHPDKLLVQVPLSVPVTALEVTPDSFRLAKEAKELARASLAVDDTGAALLSCKSMQRWRCANGKTSVPSVSFIGTSPGIRASRVILPLLLDDVSTEDTEREPCKLPNLSAALQAVLEQGLYATHTIPVETSIQVELTYSNPDCGTSPAASL